MTNKSATQVREILHQRFPMTFAGQGQPKMPLSVGIKAEILNQCPDLSPGDVQIALADYTGGPTYLRACEFGAPRIGLDGLVNGNVTESQASYHLHRLHKLQASWRKRTSQPEMATA